jgi:regulator of nucleoside diphosphate kinase
MNSSHAPYGAPPIIISRRDAKALTRVAIGSILSAPRSAAPLLREVDRATIVPDLELPEDAAGIGAHVCFRDLESGRVRSVVLAASPAVEAGDQTVSVLSPLGAALVGLRPGQSIRWPDLHGETMRLMVLAVSRAPLQDAE